MYACFCVSVLDLLDGELQHQRSSVAVEQEAEHTGDSLARASGIGNQLVRLAARRSRSKGSRSIRLFRQQGTLALDGDHTVHPNQLQQHCSARCAAGKTSWLPLLASFAVLFQRCAPAQFLAGIMPNAAMTGDARELLCACVRAFVRVSGA